MSSINAKYLVPLLSMAATLLAAPALAAPSQTASTLPLGTLVEHKVRDRNGVTVTYYQSETSTPKPLLLFVQGSGCDPVMFKSPSGQTGSTIFGAFSAARSGQFSVVIVSKPFAKTDFSTGGGDARTCSEQFNAYFTLQNWRDSLSAALKAARRAPYVDQHKVLVFGTSEGAVMAGVLAGRHSFISHVAAIGLSGDNQLFDIATQVYAQNPGSPTIDAIQNSLYADVAKVFQSPNSSTDFLWGHPYKRWASFLPVSFVEEISKSRAELFIFGGVEDRNVPIQSAEFAASKLAIARRPFKFVRIAGADHMLMKPNGDWSDLDGYYQQIFEWFVAPTVAPEQN